ncbi:hypothetical protein GA0074695_6288 [Micromonospora viridifaciens]|uniref:Uncharacterized protein n=1 Tax=Micromonospora viridifaciens TaxID=1881 RepID=A0A1C4ZXJ0_MICVI|nr:hypothetical protein [Micromonospora viridifaciens]SCF37649.1 hypothetical protein GA0074695_6288 [Micromonospora viridifaciens]
MTRARRGSLFVGCFVLVSWLLAYRFQAAEDDLAMVGKPIPASGGEGDGQWGPAVGVTTYAVLGNSLLVVAMLLRARNRAAAWVCAAMGLVAGLMAIVHDALMMVLLFLVFALSQGRSAGSVLVFGALATIANIAAASAGLIAMAAKSPSGAVPVRYTTPS